MPPIKGEGLIWKAILARSNTGETVRTCRPKMCWLLFKFGGVRGTVKECRRDTTGFPVRNLRVRSRVGVAIHEVHTLRLGSTKDGYLKYEVLAEFYIEYLKRVWEEVLAPANASASQRAL